MVKILIALKRSLEKQEKLLSVLEDEEKLIMEKKSRKHKDFQKANVILATVNRLKNEKGGFNTKKFL